MFSSSYIGVCLILGALFMACQAGKEDFHEDRATTHRVAVYYPSKLTKICRSILKPSQPYLKKTEREKLSHAMKKIKTTPAPRDEPYECKTRLPRTTNQDGCCIQDCDLYENMTTATNYEGHKVTIHHAYGRPQCFHLCTCREIPLCGASTGQQCRCMQEWRLVYAQVRDPKRLSNIIRDFIRVPACCRSVVTP